MRRVRDEETGELRYPSMAELRRSGFAGRPAAELPATVLSVYGDEIPTECATEAEIDAHIEGRQLRAPEIYTDINGMSYASEVGSDSPISTSAREYQPYSPYNPYDESE